ncbi:MAG: hypothetical protein KBE41_07640 [Lutibacter sp.]|nr:hypothetical protein [Lutibacter sp.]MBP9601361.1 hypothetical protein [Lutibacter sp.]
MTVFDLIGNYTVEGKNQDEGGSAYVGTLKLVLNENDKIIAEWTVSNHKQFGTGFFKNNILVINFYYEGEDTKKYKGVVVYHFLTPKILDGFWSEKYGDQQFLGEERCYKTDTVILPKNLN